MFLTRSLLALNLWLLIIAAMAGISKSELLFFTFSKFLNYLVYSALVLLFATSAIASFGYRWFSQPIEKIIGMAIVGIITVLSFFVPSMAWFMIYKPILIILFIYLTALPLMCLAYVLWWRIEGRYSSLISLYTAMTTYALIVLLMILRLLASIQ
ncbi:MAG: hypothetical protein ACYCT2_06605 [Thermoplasmataceae archaeon]